MVKRNVEDALDVQNTSKALPIIKWIEYFADFIYWTVGEIKTSLSYVIYKSDTVPGVAPLMVRGKSYYEENGYVEKEIIVTAHHNNHHFKEDNSRVYYYIEEETRTPGYYA